MAKYLYEELSSKIIQSIYRVYDKLGYGFLESVYENALLIELKRLGVEVENQKELKVYYDNEIVGIFRSDIIVEDKIIIELKSVVSLTKIHEVQLVNYLKSTKLKVGILVNFGEKLEIKRKYFEQ